MQIQPLYNKLGKLVLFTLLLVLKSHAGVCQGFPEKYTQEIALADSLMRAKKFCEAAQCYSNTFDENNMSVDLHVLLAAKCWNECGDSQKCIEYLQKLVYRFLYADPGILEQYFRSSPVYHTRSFKEIIKYSKLSQQNNLKAFNPGAARLLDSLYILDQTGRSLPAKRDQKIQYESNESSILLIDSLYKKLGWLHHAQVGYNASMAQFLVIQHASLPVMKKWKPRVKQASKQALTLVENYCLLVDRIRMYSGKKQIYGTQPVFDTVTNRYQPYPIANKKNVDKRRKSKGMEPLSRALLYK